MRGVDAQFIAPRVVGDGVLTWPRLVNGEYRWEKIVSFVTERNKLRVYSSLPSMAGSASLLQCALGLQCRTWYTRAPWVHKGTRRRKEWSAATPALEELEQLALRFIDPIQHDYEDMRSVVLADETPVERNRITCVDRDTIGEKAHPFL